MGLSVDILPNPLERWFTMPKYTGWESLHHGPWTWAQREVISLSLRITEMHSTKFSVFTNDWWIPTVVFYLSSGNWKINTGQPKVYCKQSLTLYQEVQPSRTLQKCCQCFPADTHAHGGDYWNFQEGLSDFMWSSGLLSYIPIEALWPYYYGSYSCVVFFRFI